MLIFSLDFLNKSCLLNLSTYAHLLFFFYNPYEINALFASFPSVRLPHLNMLIVAILKIIIISNLLIPILFKLTIKNHIVFSLNLIFLKKDLRFQFDRDAFTSKLKYPKH